MARSRYVSLFFLNSLAAAFAVGCGSSGGNGGSGGPDLLIDNGFESDDPSASNASSGAEKGGTADAGTASSEPTAPPADANGAARAIEEADILKLEGTRLYTLSRYGGLAIVDVSDPDHLKMLGRKRTEGIPFEMYVRDGRAYVMMNDFGRWVRSPESPYGQWRQTSELLTLDLQNPGAVTEIAHYDVPGRIADSRIVGDALYLVTNESGYCWGCQRNNGTIVTSFNVAGGQIAKVDQLAYTTADKAYTAWQRSVSATNERLYIAGPEWDWRPGAQNGSSVIQVVDIKDPGGKLKKGTDVHIAGQINSRWQMDEYQGVLRVVSQQGNGWGNSGINPKVQTYTVNSATSITPLGQTEIKMPMPESLRSVRFDGTRGYAITAQRTDPLFTIDLSNPAAPKQAGELEMPGWIFHMEPRGDRLVGFGYDAANSLAVTLFDVTNMAAPVALKTVSFGQGWGQLAEDQDRIHKSVRVLDDKGLILVPFASYGAMSNDGKCVRGQSGIQLIDMARDSLTLRGVAPQYGMSRRALFAGDRLLGVSDRNVTSFDITSRDAPAKKSELDVSNPAYRMVAVGSHIASISNDWWSGEAMLSLTPKDRADDADVTAKVSLAPLATIESAMCSSNRGWTAWYQARLFANGNFVYLTVPVYSYGSNSSSGKLVAAAIDVTDPKAPKIVSQSEVALTKRDGYYGGYGFWDGYSAYSYYGGSLVASGQGVVQMGSKLVYLEVDREPFTVDLGNGRTRYDAKIHRKLHVVDFTVPTAAKVSAPINLGDSLGVAPLHVWGGSVITSRWIPSLRTAGKVRFYVDRVDVSGPIPMKLSSLNTPGSILLADESSQRLVMADYTQAKVESANWQTCRSVMGYRAQFNYDTNDCVVVSRTFKLADVVGSHITLRDTMTPPSQNIAGIETADNRLYVTHQRVYDYEKPIGTNEGYQVSEDGGLWAIGGIREGKLAVVSEMKGDAQWILAAKGSKVAVYTEGGLAIYDTKTPSPALVKEVNLRGWGYSSHILMDENKAVFSLGEWGLQTVTY